MNNRDVCRVVRNSFLLAVALGLTACGAGQAGGEDVGEVTELLTSSCPAGYPNNGGITIIGTAAGETLTGTSGGDCIIANGGNDIINGLGGADYLIGGAGDDTINGGDGDDVILGETGNDTINGGNGNDNINSLVNSGGNDIIHGDDGNDHLTGGNGNDQLYGDAGNDLIDANYGDDYVDGGDGNDNLNGNAGNDTMTGGVGDDKVYGNDGNDTLNGDVGNDYMWGGNGDDTINGGDGVDTIRGEGGIDTIHGDAGDDLIYGGTEGDIIHGDAGNDVLYGEDGDDQLFGDDGDDRLVGGLGVDALSGGTGNDLMDEGSNGGNCIGDDGNDAIVQGGTVNGAVGTDACTGLSCELAEPTIGCPLNCGAGRRCAREVSFCIYCQSDSECTGGKQCIPTKGCTAVESNCSNGTDDDGDGAIDCKDSDCVDNAACKYSFGGGAGSWHGCVTSTAGGVSCWGRNNLCQLGFNGQGATPGAVTGISTASDVRGGSYNSCVLLASGAVQCWGAKTNGMLGDGGAFTGDCTKTPTNVLGVSGVTQLAVGAGHACVLSGGSIKCWGSNNTGQLGVNNGAQSFNTATDVVGISNAVQIAAGSQNTCALLNDGTVKCWGRNHRGQLGGNGTVGTSSWVPLVVPGVSGVAQINVGQDYVCARKANGTVSCWGENAYGSLGGGTVGGISSSPVASLITSVITIQTGAYHTCAIRQGGLVSCWGANSDGQLGIGTTSAGTGTPIVTAPAVSAVSLEMGRAFTCAKDSTGIVNCWGDNAYGQIASDSPTDHTTATVKTGLPP